MKLLLLFIFTFSAYQVNAVNYYLSAQGKDSNDGKSKTSPWQSLKNLDEAIILQTGDSIFFERGSTFKGSLTVSHSGVYIGAYGYGSRPIFSGSMEVNNWTLFEKNIWKAECSSCPAEPGDLYIDNKIQRLGRFPNSHYLIVSGSSQSRAIISDTSLNFAIDYWNKAEVVVKSSRWTLDNLPVTYYKDNGFHTLLNASYKIENGFGYFVQKHLSTLDQSGEWFFNENTKEFFLYLTDGINPNDHAVEASMNLVGINAINSQDIVIENLTLKYFKTTSIHVENCTNVIIQNNELLHSAKNGLEIISSRNLKVINNRIADSNNNGVNWHNSGGSFSNNIILRTGLHQGRGVSGNGTYIAIYITGENQSAGKNLFHHNTIDSTGYSGIDFRTGNTSIKDNIISNFCLRKDDGAGIYTWNNTLGGNVIEANTVSNGIGSGEGTINPRQLFASGIYIDDRSSHILIKANKVSHCSTAGIYIHNAKVITIIANNVFSNGNNPANKEKGQLYIKLDTLGRLGGKVALDLKIALNKWTATSESSYCMFLSADKKNDLNQLGAFSQNQFTASHSSQSVAQSFHQEGLCHAPEEFTLPMWQNNTKNENGSTFKQLKGKSDFEIIGKNMITNGNMTLSTNGWIIWPAQSTIMHEKLKVIDGPALEVFVPTSTEALLYRGGFPLDNKKYYRLSFSIMSAENSTIEFVPLMAGSPWQALGDYTCFTTGSTYRTYFYFFKPGTSCLEARVNFKSNTTFWIDSISLHEVIMSPYLSAKSKSISGSPEVVAIK